MKIGFTTYPTAFQSKGGLEVHIKQTRNGLRELGYDVDIVDPYHQRLDEFDLIHHFSLNHAAFRIVQKAKRFGVPVVLTPMVEAIHSPMRIRKIRWVRYLMHRTFGSEFRSRWDDTVAGLQLADAVTPLTKVEANVITAIAPDCVDKISVIANGVTNDFFTEKADALAAPYQQHGDFILLASSIVPYKNQLNVIRSANRAGYKTLMIGAVVDQAYFQSCLDEGAEYLGELAYPSDELIGLFAAARLVMLASHIEPFGLVPFEALACGSASALTTASGFDMPAEPPYFQRVNPRSTEDIEQVVRKAMSAPRDRRACRAIVEDMRWIGVAKQVAEVYQRVNQ